MVTALAGRFLRITGGLLVEVVEVSYRQRAVGKHSRNVTREPAPESCNIHASLLTRNSWVERSFDCSHSDLYCLSRIPGGSDHARVDKPTTRPRCISGLSCSKSLAVYCVPDPVGRLFEEDRKPSLSSLAVGHSVRKCAATDQ